LHRVWRKSIGGFLFDLKQEAVAGFEHEVIEDLLLGALRGYRGGFEQLGELLEDSFGKSAREVLEAETRELAIVGVEGAEGDLEGLAGQDQRQEAKDMFEALVGPVAEYVIEKGEATVGSISVVEQLAAFPDGARNRELFRYEV
jgi:hypothetical protein